MAFLKGLLIALSLLIQTNAWAADTAPDPIHFLQCEAPSDSTLEVAFQQEQLIVTTSWTFFFYQKIEKNLFRRGTIPPDMHNSGVRMEVPLDACVLRTNEIFCSLNSSAASKLFMPKSFRYYQHEPGARVEEIRIKIEAQSAELSAKLSLSGQIAEAVLKLDCAR